MTTPGGSLNDVNDAGDIVGAIGKSVFDESGAPVDLGSRPARWDGAGTALTELGVLGLSEYGTTAAEATAINNAGVVVGTVYSWLGDPIGVQTAVRWDASSTAPTPLALLPTSVPGKTSTAAFAINSTGTIVGGANEFHTPAGRFAAMRWDASGTATELDKPAGALFAVVTPFPAALNDAGTAVGWAEFGGAVSSVKKGRRALRWDGSGTVATELGYIDLVNGFAHSQAWAVNAAGAAVGVAGKDIDGFRLEPHAVYWGADGAAIDLNTLIDPSSGWLLSQAWGISDTGWIVGEGFFDPDGPGGQADYARHFLMHVPPTAVPEPGAWMLLLIGGTLLAGRRPVALRTAAGEAYRQVKAPHRREHLPRRSVCALTGDDVLIVPQTRNGRHSHDKVSIDLSYDSSNGVADLPDSLTSFGRGEGGFSRRLERQSLRADERAGRQ